jgi:hypothetical protein
MDWKMEFTFMSFIIIHSVKDGDKNSRILEKVARSIGIRV